MCELQRNALLHYNTFRQTWPLRHVPHQDLAALSLCCRNKRRPIWHCLLLNVLCQVPMLDFPKRPDVRHAASRPPSPTARYAPHATSYKRFQILLTVCVSCSGLQCSTAPVRYRCCPSSHTRTLCPTICWPRDRRVLPTPLAAPKARLEGVEGADGMVAGAEEKTRTLLIGFERRKRTLLLDSFKVEWWCLAVPHRTWREFDILPSPAAAQEVRIGGAVGAEGMDPRAGRKKVYGLGDSNSKKWLAACFRV